MAPRCRYRHTQLTSEFPEVFNGFITFFLLLLLLLIIIIVIINIIVVVVIIVIIITVVTAGLLVRDPWPLLLLLLQKRDCPLVSRSPQTFFFFL